MTRKTTTSPNAPSDALAKITLRVERLRTRRARSIDETTEELWTDLTENPTPAFMAQLRLWCDADDGPIADEAARTLSMFAHPMDGPRIARLICSGSEQRAMDLFDAASELAEDESSFDKMIFAVASDIALGKVHADVEDDDVQREAVAFMMRTDPLAARELFASPRFWKPGNPATRAYLTWLASQPEASRPKFKIPHNALASCATWIETRLARTRNRQKRFVLRYWLFLVYGAMWR